ncbi:MAG TPA: glycosyltransferase family 2 protein [Flavitalea sp.]|nr:glycosyltransferase family 2 protein [Flavitalea sp.]
MKISIITATFNSAATVNDTLQSVSMQNYHDVEHIIVDGGSSDGTLRLARSFPHLSSIISEKDEGIYDAMNKGIRRAGGEIIGILNSDDIYTHPEVLTKVAHAFADPSVDVVYGDLQYVDPVNLNRVTRTWKAGTFHRSSFYFGWMPPHPTFFVRKKIYDTLGVFNISLRSSADYELMLRILLKNGKKAVYIPEILVKMRAGGYSNASMQNRVKANREDKMAWKLNGLRPFFFTLYLKPLRKIKQFIIK